MKSPKVFIDGSNITYLCMFTAEKRTKEPMDEAFLNVYHMVVSKMRKMYPSHDLLMAWEGDGNSIIHRLEIFEGYKQNRVYDPAKSTRVYRELAKSYNGDNSIDNVSLFEAEADDTIYALANIFKETADRNVIISSDMDFIQVAQEGLVAEIFSYQTKKYREMPDYDIVAFKSLAGDSSDGIPGVKGCGPKTALKYLKEGIPAEHQDTYEKFWKVVSLKYFSEKYNTIKRLQARYHEAC